MDVVVDVSVIVPLVLSGGHLGPLAGHGLLAPPLLRSETTSVIHELTHRGQVPREQGRAAVQRLGGLDIRLESAVDLAERAWDLANSLGWAKTYDAEYLALAALLDVPLVTLDARLQRGAGRLVRIVTPTHLRPHPGTTPQR